MPIRVSGSYPALRRALFRIKCCFPFSVNNELYSGNVSLKSRGGKFALCLLHDICIGAVFFCWKDNLIAPTYLGWFQSYGKERAGLCKKITLFTCNKKTNKKNKLESREDPEPFVRSFWGKKMTWSEQKQCISAITRSTVVVTSASE